MSAGGTPSQMAKRFARVAAAGVVRPSATRPFSIRLSDAERQTLNAEAGSKPLGTYVRACLLESAPRRKVQGCTGQNTAVLSQILGRIAKLQWTSSLSDLGNAARIGALVITPELEHEILTLSQEVRDIRLLLMRALGFSVEERP